MDGKQIHIPIATMMIEPDTSNFMVEISYTSAPLVGQQTCSGARLWLSSALGRRRRVWLSLKTLRESFGSGLGMLTMVGRSDSAAVDDTFQRERTALTKVMGVFTRIRAEARNMASSCQAMKADLPR